MQFATAGMVLLVASVLLALVSIGIHWAVQSPTLRPWARVRLTVANLAVALGAGAAIVFLSLFG